MIRKALVTAAAGIAIIAASSFAPSRANAMPMGLPAAAIDQIDITEAVALCFYIDGWNGPGMYQCGYRMRRGYGWHGARSGGRVVSKAAAIAAAACIMAAAVNTAAARAVVAAIRVVAAASITSDNDQNRPSRNQAC